MYIHCDPAELGRYALVGGDPGRIPLISSFFEGTREVVWERQFRIHTGYFHGLRIVAASHGIGGPSAAIAFLELSRLGVDTIVRAGTAGPIQTDRCRSGFVVATGAIRDEMTSAHYLPVEFPAVPDLSVVNALIRAAQGRGVEYHAGVVQSKDSFYGELEPLRHPVASRLTMRWEAWRMGGALASEMECASLFIVGAVRGLRTGAILNLSEGGKGMEEMILIGLDALRFLAEQDAPAKAEAHSHAMEGGTRHPLSEAGPM